jgi:hypothetical protein
VMCIRAGECIRFCLGKLEFRSARLFQDVGLKNKAKAEAEAKQGAKV